MFQLRRRATIRLTHLEERIAPASLPVGYTETMLPGTITSGTAMEFSPDGKLFVLQQGGQCKVYERSGSTWVLQQNDFFVDATLTVNSSGERGLLGIAFDPNFATNRYIYFYHTTSTSPIHNRVIRETANVAGDKALAGQRTTILDLNNLSATNHNGGAMHFGTDGKLYIAVGENAVSSNAQSSANLLGKMLRINPVSDPVAQVPTDNPFYNTFSGQNRLIWAMGLRNPYTFAFRPGTSQMYINDVGQSAYEEINIGAAGANYGWSTTEGPFNQATNPSFTHPILWYHHSNSALNSPTGAYTGIAITGGAFYNPATYTFPQALVGDYFYADYGSSWIKSYDAAANTVTDFAASAGSVVDLKVGSEGALYYLSRGNSRVYFAQFTGNTAPYVVTNPASTSTPVGQPATFSVVAGGSPAPTYQWQRNNVDIPGATSSNYTTPPTLASDNSATYRAVVTNGSGNTTSNPATLTVTNIPQPARVMSFQIEDGSQQRSMVRKLTVTFDTIVSFVGAPANAFGLTPTGPTIVVGAIDNASGHSVVSMTFSGAGLDGASLIDGQYQFRIFGDQIRDAAGQDLDGNGDTTPGGDYATGFFRLYGDGTGDGTVGQADFNMFRLAFLGGPSIAFDVNDNGQVSQDDFDRFRMNFGTSI